MRLGILGDARGTQHAFAIEWLAIKHTSKQRGFSTSRSTHTDDLYSVLGLPHTASKAQIKSQFYQLSKKYHPDVSKNEEGKRMFQRVSEAYATLGNDRSRKAYDQQFTRRASPTPPGATYGYDASDNQRRRATANYAWEHRRRTTQRAKKHAHSTEAPPPPPNATNLFATFAERESRREAARAQSAYTQRSTQFSNPDSFRAWSERRWSQQEKDAERMSPTVRFFQVGAVLGTAAWLSTKVLS
ncbi:peroxisome-assembly ATPase [Malassezia yamatoensis]|uniref:Peroxisome-assembly ATPase n=1 Tax=Malassezia yamatoensis TaxID=253288 RepID=A0AAJ5YUI6_9BASI|nr:peroxisome-assembly ATPase [Malassezia yamatoensis]